MRVYLIIIFLFSIFIECASHSMRTFVVEPNTKRQMQFLLYCRVRRSARARTLQPCMCACVRVAQLVWVCDSAWSPSYAFDSHPKSAVRLSIVVRDHADARRTIGVRLICIRCETSQIYYDGLEIKEDINQFYCMHKLRCTKTRTVCSCARARARTPVCVLDACIRAHI